MPHYKDGTQAKVGDVVRGRGYNIKGEIEGVILNVTPGTDKCNVVVATFASKLDARQTSDMHSPPEFVAGEDQFYGHRFGIEYGQADAFEKVEAT